MERRNPPAIEHLEGALRALEALRADGKEAPAGLREQLTLARVVRHRFSLRLTAANAEHVAWLHRLHEAIRGVERAVTNVVTVLESKPQIVWKVAVQHYATVSPDGTITPAPQRPVDEDGFLQRVRQACEGWLGELARDLEDMKTLVRAYYHEAPTGQAGRPANLPEENRVLYSLFEEGMKNAHIKQAIGEDLLAVRRAMADFGIRKHKTAGNVHESIDEIIRKARKRWLAKIPP